VFLQRQGHERGPFGSGGTALRTCITHAATGNAQRTQINGVHSQTLECSSSWMALCTLPQPLCLHMTRRNRHSRLCAARDVNYEVQGVMAVQRSHSECFALQECRPSVSMRLKHAAAARLTASSFAACTAVSACAWMAASFVSGVSALAKMLKLLRRPLTSAASHVLKCEMAPSSEGSCAPLSGLGQVTS